jgi:hypothetical protein
VNALLLKYMLINAFPAVNNTAVTNAPVHTSPQAID